VLVQGSIRFNWDRHISNWQECHY